MSHRHLLERSTHMVRMALLARSLLASLMLANAYGATGASSNEATFSFTRANAGPAMLTVSMAGRTYPVLLAPAAQKAFVAAEDVFAVRKLSFLFGGRTYFILAAKEPSTSRRGMGFCGAGYETRILLLEWRGPAKPLQLRDRLLIDSCLQGMDLDTGGGDLVSTLSRMSSAAGLELKWLSHPKYGDVPVRVTVNNSRFWVE
jgi:hypothetical protein